MPTVYQPFGSWKTPEAILVDDYEVAATYNASSESVVNTGVLRVTGFLTVPPLSEIHGVEVRVAMGGSTTISSLTQRLCLNGNPIGDNKIGQTWANTDGTMEEKSIGGPTDLWGIPDLDHLMVNNPTFGHQSTYRMDTTKKAPGLGIYTIKMRLWYWDNRTMVKVGGIWRKAGAMIMSSGVWKPATPRNNQDGVWK